MASSDGNTSAALPVAPKPKRGSQLVATGHEKRLKMSQRDTASESHLRLLREGKGSDVTFLVHETERIPCHKSFLVARSPVFEAMFSERWNNNNEANMEIPIPDTDAITLRRFLEYVYADVFRVEGIWDALGLLDIAQKYDVQLLVEKCEELIEREMKLKDSVTVFEASAVVGSDKCKKLAGDMMANAKSLEAIATEENLDIMNKSTLIYLLKRCDVAAKEVELFNIALQWGRTQVRGRRAGTSEEALADIIPLIRFPVMTLNEFTTVVVPTGLLKQDVVVEIFTYFGSDKAAQKNLEKNLKFSTVPRKPLGTDIVVPLYDESNVDEEVQATMHLTDHVGFRVQPASTPLLAIRGIILRCPVNNSADGEGQCLPTEGWNEDDFFQISIFRNRLAHEKYPAKLDFDDSTRFSKVMVISPVKLEWGQDMEVKVDPPVPLKFSRSFITLQQAQNSEKE